MNFEILKSLENPDFDQMRSPNTHPPPKNKSDLSLTHYRPAIPFGKKKYIIEDLFSSVLSQLKKKYHPSGNL